MLYFFKRLKDRVIWSWAGCMDAWRNEHSFRSWVWANLASATLAFVLPLETGERALILALGVLAFRFALQLAGFIRLVLYPNATPVAVPLIADVAKQANIEAEQASSEGGRP